MRDAERQWFWVLAAHMHKVDMESMECDSILRELVQRCPLPPRNGMVPNTAHFLLHLATAATLILLLVN